MSYKVAIIATGESTASYNGLRFATKEEADHYARDLYSRWFGMESYTIEECDDPVNR